MAISETYSEVLLGVNESSPQGDVVGGEEREMEWEMEWEIELVWKIG